MKAKIEFIRNGKTAVPPADYQGTFAEITQMVSCTVKALHQTDEDNVSFRLHSMQYFTDNISGQKETHSEFLRGMKAAIKMAVNKV